MIVLGITNMTDLATFAVSLIRSGIIEKEKCGTHRADPCCDYHAFYRVVLLVRLDVSRQTWELPMSRV